MLSGDSAGALEAAVRVLRHGGLVALPTDTVYGLAALAFDGLAVQAIYAAKGRPSEKAIPVLLADLGQAERVAAVLPAMARKLAQRFWPGPLTIAVPKIATLPEIVSAYDTVGVRVPDHALARQLLQICGPLAVTSANISGAASPITAEQVQAQLGGRIELVLDGGRTPGGVPSTVVECTAQGPRIVRAGPIGMEELLAALAAGDELSFNS